MSIINKINSFLNESEVPVHLVYKDPNNNIFDIWVTSTYARAGLRPNKLNTSLSKFMFKTSSKNWTDQANELEQSLELAYEDSKGNPQEVLKCFKDVTKLNAELGK